MDAFLFPGKTTKKQVIGTPSTGPVLCWSPCQLHVSGWPPKASSINSLT